MKKIFSLPVFITFTIFLLTFTSPVHAKDYSIKSANIEVRINTDGSADVTETRNYDFSGSYSWADEWLLKKEFRISNFELWEGKISFEQNNTALPGTFSVQDNLDKIYLKWYYKALDTEKTFTLKYKIQNAVTNQKDISEFYWQLIGDSWTKGTGQVTATIHLSYEVPNDKVWAFGHGPLNGKVDIVSNQEIDFSAENLPANKFFEIRVLFPTNSSFVNVKTGSQSLSSILSEEKGFANNTKTRAIGIVGVIGVMSLILIWRTIIWLVRWNKIGKDDPLPEVNLAGTLHESPNDLDPTFVETMLNGYPSGKSIVATILELTRRKILSIDFVKGGRKSFFGNKDQYFLVLKNSNYQKDVSAMEGDLINFLFSDEPKIDFTDIKNIAKTSPTSANTFWMKWKKDAEQGLKDLGFYEPESLTMQTKGGWEVVGWGIVTFLYFQFGLFIIFPQGLFVIIPCDVIMLLVVVSMRKKSKWGGEEVAKWKAFKKWLKDYSVTKNYPIDSVILWEKYLVYGTVLGVSVKALSQLPIKFSEAMQQTSGIYMGFYSGGRLGEFGGLGRFENTFSALSSSFGSYGAAGVGSSGGFSGEGGGGGGGGGGGAG